MKYLKKYNENINFDDIDEEEFDNDNFDLNIDFNKYYIIVFNYDKKLTNKILK